MNSKVYKSCAVPQCVNTTIKTPNKLFVYVPNNKTTRFRWLKLARRDPKAIKLNTSIYFCEDHFDLPNSMENFMEYHVMGSVSQVRMKAGCMPTKFECQPHRRKRTSDTKLPFIVKKERQRTSDTELPFIVKKERQTLILEEAIKDSKDKSITTKHLDLGETSSGSPVVHEDIKNILTQEEHKTADKSIQVYMTHKFRSKGIQTGIIFDQTKILIAKVYHYFEQEYEELKTIYGDLDLTPLSKFVQRTALAAGVSETTVLQILKEEESRNAEKREEPPEKRRRARKRPIQTESSSLEDCPDDTTDADKESKSLDDSSLEDCPDDTTDADKESKSLDEAHTLVVKVEPEFYNDEPEIYVPATVKEELSDIEINIEQPQTDPIALNEETEPRSDVLDNTNETLALTGPASTERKEGKIPRSDVTSTRDGLFGDTEMETEEIGIHEEGPS